MLIQASYETMILSFFMFNRLRFAADVRVDSYEFPVFIQNQFHMIIKEH